MLKEILREYVNKKVEQMYRDSYDEKTGLLYDYNKGVNYHTAVEEGVVHRTRENLSWIPALISWNREVGIPAAVRAVPEVLKLQDRDPDSPTYGIWPYLFEEPLAEMKNPDWNWAPFLGGSLITILHECGNLLPGELQENMKEALKCACESILRRKMGADYTNIVLMSGFVLTAGGELLENKEFIENGLKVLRQQLEFVRQNGGFAEYNSPTYGMIDIEETGRILYYAKNEEALRLARRLHGYAWKVFAEHYHAPTGQIAPPHARCYDDIQGTDIHTLITVGTKGRCKLVGAEEWDVNLMWPYMELDCPAEYEKYFAAPEYPRIQEEDFYRGFDPIRDDQIRVLIEKGTPKLHSCTYLHPDYCLGTFAWHDMWNQRRPLMAFVRTEEGTACFRARCMHDDMDFAGALMQNVQHENAAAGGVSFVTDHGDYHYILTPLEDGAMEAERLSLDFTVTGAPDRTAVKELGKGGYLFTVGGCEIELHILKACFGDGPVQAELIDTAECKGVRLNLYQGERTRIDFHEIGKAYILYGVEIRRIGEKKKSVYRISEEETGVSLETSDGFSGQIQIDPVPGKFISGNENRKKKFRNGGFYYETLFKDLY